MADTKKFEDMLEHLVNGDKVAAEDLFHTIVVEKSRLMMKKLMKHLMMMMMMMMMKNLTKILT